jgi:hypothetical protein
VRVDAIRDSSPHDYVAGRFNGNGSQTINYADFDQLSKGGKGGFDSSAGAVHETTEAYAGLTEGGPGKTVLDFHKTGISYENMVRADKGLGARGSEVSDTFGRETFVTVDYTTHVEHYTLVQTGQGKFVVKDVKVEKKQ